MPDAWPAWNKSAEAASLIRYVSDDARLQLERLGIERLHYEINNERRAVVEALYNAALTANISYVLEKFDPSDGRRQRIRTPAEVLVRPGEGTCLDLAALFCGLCLGADLLPIIILLDGHALAAVSLRFGLSDWEHPDRRPERNLFDDETACIADPEALLGLVDGHDYVVVECTGFACSTVLSADVPEGAHRVDGVLTFERAIEAGRKQLEFSERPLWKAFDVARLGDLPKYTFDLVEPRGTKLDDDVRRSFAALLDAVGGAPRRWDLAQLKRVRDRLQQDVPASADPSVHGRALSATEALLDAVVAKDVLAKLDASRIPLKRLTFIYNREIGVWPRNADSIDTLLTEAASVSRADELENRTGSVLSSFERFVLGVVAERGEIATHPAVESWLADRNIQRGDAEVHIQDLQSASTVWLLIDLGAEPNQPASRSETGPCWPTSVSATLFVKGLEPLVFKATSEPTKEWLTAWLREVTREVNERVADGQQIVVDLAMPRGLLDQEIEHWPLIDVAGEFQTLAEHWSPRLRWSHRTRDRMSRELVLRWAKNADRKLVGKLLPDELASDREALKNWSKDTAHPPWMVATGRPNGAVNDPLMQLLRQGCPFVIWFPAGMTSDHETAIREAEEAVPSEARSTSLPDEIARRRLSSASVIWDDPKGRDDYLLPDRSLRGPLTIGGS